MKVSVDSLLVNRAPLTRRLGSAGQRVVQSPTHLPCFERVCSGQELSWDGSGYAFIRRASGVGAGYDTQAKLAVLLTDIKKNGVRVAVNGWRLHYNIELFGGHHRVLAAKAAGIATVEFTPRSLDPMAEQDPKPPRAAYKAVYAEHKLASGMSYNPVLGLRPIRRGLDRLRMLYEDIITVSGDRLADLGCNDGYFGIAMTQHDFRVTFVDRSKSYLGVVSTKLRVLGCEPSHEVINGDVADFLLLARPDEFSVVLYTDVFYHRVVEAGMPAALSDLDGIFRVARERVIIAPGRWDKLAAHGFTEMSLLTFALDRGWRVRYLGRDGDGPNYGREIYSAFRA